MPKFGIKTVLFDYFWGRILKKYCRIQISTLKFVKLQHFPKKQKCLNLGPRMTYLGILGVEF